MAGVTNILTKCSKIGGLRTFSSDHYELPPYLSVSVGYTVQHNRFTVVWLVVSGVIIVNGGCSAVSR